MTRICVSAQIILVYAYIEVFLAAWAYALNMYILIRFRMHHGRFEYIMNVLDQHKIETGRVSIICVSLLYLVARVRQSHI